MKVTRLERLKHRFFSRAVDFWTSLFILILGLYGVLDAPEHVVQDSPMTGTFIIIIGAYYIVASLVILWSIVADPEKRPVMIAVGQEYAWLFIGSAAVSTMVLYIASLWYIGTPDNVGEFVLWTWIWIALGTLSFTHWWHLRRRNRGR
jgi:hypothetical protein